MKQTIYLKSLVEKNIRLLKILHVVCFLLVSNQLFAQSGGIRGRIIDEEQEPLIGASVGIKGTSIGTVTDLNGNFYLQAKEGETVVFSYLGYLSQEMSVTDFSPMTIVLKADEQNLEEVVVIGYGTMKKKDLTGAVSVINPDDIKKVSATTLAQSLQGLASGVFVRGNSVAGSEANIEIRGISNFSNNNPLYIIDGLPSSANRDFNIEDVESVQILKDASAAAIYGSRAANGVIIITTKKGQEGPMKIDFSAKYGIQNMPRYDLMNAEQWKALANESIDNYNLDNPNAPIAYLKHPEDIDTDWQKEIFKTGTVQEYNLSLSGGSKDMNYMISGNYFGNKGMLVDNYFDRFGLRVNTGGKKGLFSFGENLALSRTTVDEYPDLNWPVGPIYSIVRLLPTIPVYNENNFGGYGYGDEQKARSFATNSIALSDLVDQTNQNLRLRASLWGEFDFWGWAKYKLNLGYEASSDQYAYFRKEGNWTMNQPKDPSLGNENKAMYESKLMEHTLTFDRVFKEHHVNAMVGFTYQDELYKQIWGSKRNFIKTSEGKYYTVLDAGLDKPETGGFNNEGVLLSYLGRLNYDYANRYLLSLTVRRDGTSKLSPDHRWETFPSIAVGWRISEEKFFKVKWIDNLKLRATYGTLGSSNIGYWDYLNTINTFSTAVFGRDQHIENGATQVKLANNNLQWEIQKQLNVGFDLAMLNQRLTISADYFNSKTDNVLYEMPIPYTTGNDGGNPKVNAASIENTGFEFNVGWKDQVQDFKYGVNLNFTKLDNKVVELGYGKSEQTTWITKTEIGEPMAMWYLIQMDGIFQSVEEVQNYKNSKGAVIQPNAHPGDVKYIDANDDGQITDADRVIIKDKKPWPDFEMGVNMNAAWKDFDFTMNWFCSYGLWARNGQKAITDGFSDYSAFRTDYIPWRADAPRNDNPRVRYGTTSNSWGNTTRWLEDASYLRLNTLVFGYTLPKKIVQKAKIDRLRAFFTGENLITITKGSYTGLDPAFKYRSMWERGHDDGHYPNPTTFTLGLQLTF